MALTHCPQRCSSVTDSGISDVLLFSILFSLFGINIFPNIPECENGVMFSPGQSPSPNILHLLIKNVFNYLEE